MTNPKNLPAVVVPNDVIAQRASDPGFLFDDLAKEGLFRGIESIQSLSLQPLVRHDAVRYPISTRAGQLLGAVGRGIASGYSKVHQLFDNASSHGPAKNSKVVPAPAPAHSLERPATQSLSGTGYGSVQAYRDTENVLTKRMSRSQKVANQRRKRRKRK